MSLVAGQLFNAKNLNNAFLSKTSNNVMTSNILGETSLIRFSTVEAVSVLKSEGITRLLGRTQFYTTDNKAYIDATLDSTYARLNLYGEKVQIDAINGLSINTADTTITTGTGTVYIAQGGVGIGTSTLTANHVLTLNGSANMTNLTLGKNGTEGNIYNLDTIHGTGDLRFSFGGTPTTINHNMLSTGLTLGSATTPTEMLDVYGDVYIRGAGGSIGGATIANAALKIGTTMGIDSNEMYCGGEFYIGTIGAYGVSFRNGGTDLMRIANNGNVGIGTGTGTPSYKLHVAGTGKFDSQLTLTTGNNLGLKIGTATIEEVGTGKLVMKNLAGLRFGSSDSWTFNEWAGIKYDSVSKILYVGGPAGSQFDANASPPTIVVDFDQGVSNVKIPAMTVSGSAALNGGFTAEVTEGTDCNGLSGAFKIVRTGATGANQPAAYFTVANFGTVNNSDFQLASYYGGSSDFRVRSRHDSTGNWKAWERFITDALVINSTSSTVTTQPASAAAVKSAYDLAALKVAKAGDTMTGVLTNTTTASLGFRHDRINGANTYRSDIGTFANGYVGLIYYKDSVEQSRLFFGTDKNLYVSQDAGTTNKKVYTEFDPVLTTAGGTMIENASITFPSAANGNITIANGGHQLRMTSSSGYVDIGAKNTSYAHFETDRANFWFGTAVRVQGEIYAGALYDKLVWHSGNFTPGNYALLSGGGTFSGNYEFAGSDVTGLYDTGAVEIREVGRVLATQSTAAYAPALSFHWGGRTQGQLALESNGEFSLRDGQTPFTANRVLNVGGLKVGGNAVWHAGNLSTSSFITSAGGTLSGNITLNNNIQIQGKKVDGTIKNLIYMSTGDNVNVGQTDNPTQLNGSTLKYYNGTTTYDIWHAGNLSTSSFITSAGGTLTGKLTIGNNVEVTGAYNFIAPNNYGYQVKNSTGTPQYTLWMNPSNQVVLGYNNQSVLIDSDAPTVRGGHKISHAGTDIVFNTTAEKAIKGSGTHNWGMYINSGGVGFYDWQNNRAVWGYNSSANTQTFNQKIIANGDVQTGALVVTGAGSPGIELKSSNGGTPFIDFSNDTTVDYDARFILEGDNSMSMYGATLNMNSGIYGIGRVNSYFWEGWIVDGGTVTITHNLGYRPIAMVTGFLSDNIININQLSDTQIQVHNWSANYNDCYARVVLY